MKKYLIFLVILIFTVETWQSLNAEQAIPLEITVIPTIDIPTGPGLELYGGNPPYSIGFGAGIRGDYTLPFLRFIFSRAALSYTLVPIPNGQVANTPDMSLITIGTGVGLKFSPFEKFNMKAGVQGGYYIGIIEGT